MAGTGRMSPVAALIPAVCHGTGAQRPWPDRQGSNRVSSKRPSGHCLFFRL